VIFFFRFAFSLSRRLLPFLGILDVFIATIVFLG